MKNNSALFVNAKVWQADGFFDEAFGVNNGHFDFTGSNKEALTLSNNYSETIDLGGRLVLPAFTDGHLHLVNGALMLKRLDCSNINTFDELRSAVNNYKKYNPNGWIIGGNLDLNRVIGSSESFQINIADTLCTDIPLYITNYDYHSAVCNSLALDLAGISNNSENFSAGEIDLSASGDLTGIIRESAMNAVYSVIPEPSLKEKTAAVTDCIKLMHEKGITTVSDITLPGDLELYKKLYETGMLNLRINSYLPFMEFENIDRHIADTSNINKDFFSIKGFKAFWDGALGSETALFSRNYKGRDHNGFKTGLVTSGRIYELAKRIDEAGYQIIIHAIGDKAVTQVLELYGSLPNTKRLRHRIEHAQHIDPRDYERFGRLGVIASVQPIHLKYDAHTVFEKLPAMLIPNTHNYIHITKTGGILNFGTDFPIVGFDPFENISLAATRETDFGEFTPEHRIPLHECIKAYTLNNAYSNHNENAAGTITKGKVADFTIFHNNIFDNFDTFIIKEVFINGEKIYSGI